MRHYLQKTIINIIDWSAQSSDLNAIENVKDDNQIWWSLRDFPKKNGLGLFRRRVGTRIKNYNKRL